MSTHTGSSGAMRVALAAMGVDEFGLLHATCEAAGHRPVVYAYPLDAAAATRRRVRGSEGDGDP